MSTDAPDPNRVAGWTTQNRHRTSRETARMHDHEPEERQAELPAHVRPYAVDKQAEWAHEHPEDAKGILYPPDEDGQPVDRLVTIDSEGDVPAGRTAGDDEPRDREEESDKASRRPRFRRSQD